MSTALRLEIGGALLALAPGEKACIACDAGTAGTLLNRILTQSGGTATAFCRAEPALLADLTVWENAALPLALQGNSLRRAKPAALELLRMLEVGHAAHALPNRLTDFERRQTALARALIGEPPLLLLEDIASGLGTVEAQRLLLLLSGQKAFIRATALFLGGSAAPEAARRYTYYDGKLTEVTV